MITVEEAAAIIQENLLYLPITEVSLTDAIGKVLREPIFADRDFPPYNRVSMDGIALRYSSYQAGEDFYKIEGLQLAGAEPLALENEDGCLEAMTGAMLPTGADTVIRYEDVKLVERRGMRFAQILEAPKSVFQNVHQQGSDRQASDLLIAEGTLITPAEIAVAATVGKTTLKVTQLPKVAIISTGDELVEIDQQPLPHQIRRSNAYMICAGLLQQGINAQLFHLPDDKEVIRTQLQDLLAQYEVILLSGGVSKGKADFIPEVLDELGVEKMFHQVAQRPGKPFWFGRIANGPVVFALPGNPLSTFVCYYRFFLPWLRSCLGTAPVLPIKAMLAEEISFVPKLTYFVPVKMTVNSFGNYFVKPVITHGSGDLAALLEADGFLELPSDQKRFAAGGSFPLIPFRNK